MFADDAKRMFEMNLLLVDDNLKLVLELVGDGTGGDRAEHFAIFTGFCRENERHPGQAFCQFAHGVELVCFALGAAVAQGFQAALVGGGQRNSQALRKKIVAGVAGRDFHLVGFRAQANNVVGENNFGFCHTKCSLKWHVVGSGLLGRFARGRRRSCRRTIPGFLRRATFSGLART